MKKSVPAKFYYVWNYVEWGGAQVLFFGIMKEARKIGEVQAILPAGSNEQLLKFLDNLQISYKFVDARTSIDPAFTISEKLRRHWKKMRSEFKFVRYLQKLEPENAIIHTEFAPWQSFLALWKLSKKTQVFTTMHNSLPPVSKWRFVLWKTKFRLLTRSKNFHIFAANKNARESLRKFVSQTAFDKIEVVYANIDSGEIQTALDADLDRSEICRKYGLPEKKFLVFCVGQFIDRKGRWIFLEAAKLLREENRDIAFVWICNSKPDQGDLEKIEDFRLGGDFKLITSDQVGVEHIDLFKLMRLADVFALPSYLEGLPISIIEAMALGIPTISTNINAIPEAIKHLETGWLIEPGNSRQLIAAILMLKDNQELREKLSSAGRQFVLENFEEKAVAKIAVDSYLKAFRRQ